ncbi:hypothetical protein CEXT_111791 [Caerostris extrusa]|uniref:Uncharacterized protein n=1 Tax=Caerostris extrusa TaxID=172846 RepID=A0AAV4Q3E0_CAEEX|nr:hypothetical protein CEXT_111791 [Caerostris extrusa]
MYCREQKIRFKKIRTKTSPLGHRNSLSSHAGVGGGFFQMAIVNQISDGRPTLRGKTGVSRRKTPGPRHRPKGTGTHSRPTRGLAEDFSQMAIVNQISGGRPTLHGKTGVSSRKTPGPRRTLKESGVPDR